MRLDQRAATGRRAPHQQRHHRSLPLLVVALAGWGLTPSARALTPGSPDRIGHWDPAFEEAPCPPGNALGCPPISQAMAPLANGDVFYFQGIEGGITPDGGSEGSARVLDLAAGTPRWTVPDAAGRAAPAGMTADPMLPCADIAQLADGRLLVAGGGSAGVGSPARNGTTRSVSSSWIVDPGNGALQPAAPLHDARRHASLVTLADGSLLAAGGSTITTATGREMPALRTETYDPEAGSWTENYAGPASESALPALPHLSLMPNGRVFYGGAGHTDTVGNEEAAALAGVQRFFDPATSSWEVVGPSPWGARQDATSVMLPLDPPYDRATVLTFGGSSGAGPSLAPVSALATVDQAGAVQHQLTGGMHRARSAAVAVPLPDGSVLALGGAGVGAGAEEADAELFVPGAERQSQATAYGRWHKVASPHHNRTHHHSAVLLADGRVLLGGQSPDGRGASAVSGDRPDASFEIFTPHYLYRSRARPTIRSAPETIAWGGQFEVGTAQALRIQSVVLMRLGSSQHGTDSDVRMLRLAFTRASGRLAVTVPPNGAVAPPGLYYLFLNQESPKGPVPSVARIVRVGAPTG